VGSQPHTTTECGGDLNLCAPPHLWDSPTQTAGTFSFTFDAAVVRASLSCASCSSI